LSASFEYGLRAHDHGRGAPPELAARLAAHGATHAQLAPSKALDGVEPRPGSFSESLAIETARAFSAAGVRVSVLGCYVDLLAPEPATRNIARARFLESLERAPLLGAGVVGTESFSGPSAAVQADMAELDPFLKALEPIARRASELGVDFALEPVSSHLVCNPGRMEYVLKRLGSDRLRVILDPVNLIDPQTPERIVEPALECIALFGSRIHAIHIKDYVPAGNALAIVPPGQGLFPFEKFFTRASALGLRCDLVIEDCRPEAVSGSVLFLGECGAELVMKYDNLQP